LWCMTQQTCPCPNLSVATCNKPHLINTIACVVLGTKFLFLRSLSFDPWRKGTQETEGIPGNSFKKERNCEKRSLIWHRFWKERNKGKEGNEGTFNPNVSINPKCDTLCADYDKGMRKIDGVGSLLNIRNEAPRQNAWKRTPRRFFCVLSPWRWKNSADSKHRRRNLKNK